MFVRCRPRAFLDSLRAMISIASSVSRLRFLGLVVGGCAALVIAGCGGGGAAAPATSPDGSALDVTGSWTGSAVDGSGNTHPVTMVVTQTGTDVAGMGTFDAKTTTILGKLNGKVWTGSLADGANQFASYSFTVEGDTANGTGTSLKDGTSAAIHLTR
jgi:hypothetical protein